MRTALAQERYYSTWRYGDTSAPASAKPSGQPDWLVAGLGGLAVLAAKGARHRVRVGQAA